MGQRGEICYMDDEIIYIPKKTKEWEDGEYEAFVEKFRWLQQHGEPADSKTDYTRPYRGEH
jgi:hypothetical protein